MKEKKKQIDRQGVTRPQYSFADMCFDMRMNQTRLALCDRSLANSLSDYVLDLNGYSPINLQWDAEKFVFTALQDHESKNNCKSKYVVMT